MNLHGKLKSGVGLGFTAGFLVTNKITMGAAKAWTGYGSVQAP